MISKRTEGIKLHFRSLLSGVPVQATESSLIHGLLQSNNIRLLPKSNPLPSQFAFLPHVARSLFGSLQFFTTMMFWHTAPLIISRRVASAARQQSVRRSH